MSKKKNIENGDLKESGDACDQPIIVSQEASAILAPDLSSSADVSGRAGEPAGLYLIEFTHNGIFYQPGKNGRPTPNFYKKGHGIFADDEKCKLLSEQGLRFKKNARD